MKINITGATGNLGKRVIEALIEQGVATSDLIASARSPQKAAHMSDKGVEVRKADFDDYDSLVEAFQGTDVLLLIPSTAAVEPRVLQHANAVKAAQVAGVGRIVHAGVATAAPDSLFEVAPFLLYAESKIRQSGLEWTLLRNNMYMESMLGWLGRFEETGQLPYPLKEGRIAFVAYADLARATAAACTQAGLQGKIFELTGPEAPNMPELAEMLSAGTGSAIGFDFPSETDYLKFSKMDKAPAPLLKILLSMYRAAEAGEWGNVTNHVELLTGYKPISILEMVAKLRGGGE